jgi:dihydrofolate reductase
MRRIVMFNRVTPEGYFSGTDGNLNWVVPEEELEKAATQAMSGTGAILFGRRTYEMFESFWPTVLDDAHQAPDPHAPHRRSPELRAMATWINGAEKLVFSRSRKSFSWKNSRLLGEFDPEAVRELKRQSGSDFMIFGSGSIVSLLTEHGLIDEYQFVMSPLLLGSGKPLFGQSPRPLPLTLREAKAFPAGNVRLTYVPAS